MRWLIVGGSGWIGGMVMRLLQKANETVHVAESRMENRESLARELDSIKPDRVINCAGKVGTPNVDWCESNREETIRCNVVGMLNVTDLCHLRGIHCTTLHSGCNLAYDDEHPLGSGRGFTDDDQPNFEGSFYSLTKGMVERLLRCYPNALILRLRMPISDDLSARSFVTKISRYDAVVNIPNSMSVLHDLLPLLVDMARRKLTSVWNFTNPGVISHNEILEMYRLYIDPSFTWRNFTLAEQALVIKAGRSNNELDARKLLAEYPHLPPVHVAVRQMFERMRAAMLAAGGLEAYKKQCMPVSPM